MSKSELIFDKANNNQLTMKSPLISIITVCYNALPEIEYTILSVINQTYSNIEYIIIDGGSTDGSIDIIKKYENKISYWVSEPDNGIYDAMNKGISLANGEWINFINSGDKFHNSTSLNAMFCKNVPDDKIVLYGDTCLSVYDHKFFYAASPIEDMQRRIPFCHQSTFVRAKYIKKHPFDLKFKVAADYKLFYNIYTSHENAFHYMPFIISDYKFGDGFSLINDHIRINECRAINGTDIKRIEKIKYHLRFLLIVIKKCLPSKLIQFHRIKTMKIYYNEID